MIIKFSQRWVFPLDARGDVNREFPQHWLGEVPIDIAAAAIAAGAAAPVTTLNAEQLAELEAAKPKPPSPPPVEHTAFVEQLRAEAAAIVTASDSDILKAYQPLAPVADQAPPPKPAVSRVPRAPRKPRS
ncbi:MAG: hypothetical protein ACOYLQ_09475 [Hyphomicrobiaceae bacterium]